MRAVIRSAALTAGSARDLTVTAEISGDGDTERQLGFPAEGQEDRRDRILAAISNSGLPWPRHQAVTITAAPAGLPPQSGSDLAAAVAVLAACGEILPGAANGIAFYGQLQPDGRIHPAPGTLSAGAAAALAGASVLVVPPACADEAKLVRDVTVVPAATLRDVRTWLRTGTVPPSPAQGPGPAARPVPDMAQVRDPRVRLAAEVSAAGGHHLLLIGQPNTAIRTVAEAMIGILPPLTHEDVLTITELHSRAGVLPDGRPVTAPPFRTLSAATRPADVAGSGRAIITPGAAPLAHHGVLFAEELPMVPHETVNALRGPVIHGDALASNASGLRVWFPSQMLLVASASPCRCLASGMSSWRCNCTPGDRDSYIRQVPGWLRDQIPLRAAVLPALPGAWRRSESSSTVVAARVLEARVRAAARFAGTPWRRNADVPDDELLRRFPPPGRDASPGRNDATTTRIAWTVADLSGHDTPLREDYALAMMIRNDGGSR